MTIPNNWTDVVSAPQENRIVEAILERSFGGRDQNFNYGFGSGMNYTGSNFPSQETTGAMGSNVGQHVPVPGPANAHNVPGNFEFDKDGVMGKIFGFLGNKDVQSGISGASSIFQMYAGMKALGLMEDKFDFAKESFAQNFNAQAKAFNMAAYDQEQAKTNAHATRGRDYSTMPQWSEARRVEYV